GLTAGNELVKSVVMVVVTVGGAARAAGAGSAANPAGSPAGRAVGGPRRGPVTGSPFHVMHLGPGRAGAGTWVPSRSGPGRVRANAAGQRLRQHRCRCWQSMYAWDCSLLATGDLRRWLLARPVLRCPSRVGGAARPKTAPSFRVQPE